ncbi:NAD(P)-binding protein [Daedaleopsis nitida]|nr:NAD(P)-binding protein [Daedaleopsis nitida]
MPATDSGKVLVTGANGYVAVWVVKTFLDHGFSVRGTVRSESKAPYLRNLFKSHGKKFEVVIVEDITKDGAFDEAVKDVDAIVHTASPFHFKAEDPAEVIDPAVRGTTGILKSALAHAPSVKRIVVTSSCASVFSILPEPRELSELDWNEGHIAEVKEKGKDASAMAKYCASKTLAERAAWEWVEAHKGEIGWDLVVLNPPYVFGPFLHEVDKPENLNESARDWYETVVKGTKDDETLATWGSCWVDVRDLALAHTLAISKQEASGERIIISAGSFKYQDFLNVAHAVYPQLPAGNTSYDPAKAVHMLTYAPQKQEKLLGIKFKTIEEMTKDTIEDFKARDWLL